MDDTYPQDLVRHVTATTGLDAATAARVVADIMAYFSQTVEEYVRERHEGLKGTYKNDDIWPRLAAELGNRRFRAPDLSERQLRRVVYG